jgi:hypothetical protein
MREEDKVVHWVKKHRPGTSKDEIVDVLRGLKEKDFYRKHTGGDDRSHYYAPIFTPYPGGYQMDLLEQSHQEKDHWDHREYPR